MNQGGFTQNYRDLSNESGFMFEFICHRCRTAHRSTYRVSKLGVIANLVKAASTLLSGNVARAGWSADNVRSAFRGSGWSKAFEAATAECRPRLSQCGKCMQWVCSETCWNGASRACLSCAPTAET
jgi:hypothetical protein